MSDRDNRVEGVGRRAVRTAVLPTIDTEEEDLEDLEIDYLDHDPAATFVVSGPLGDSDNGPGRRFRSALGAQVWARGKYGDPVRRIRDAESGGRWAMRVRKPDPRGSDGGV